MPPGKAKVIKNTDLTGDVFEIGFQTAEPFEFKAGQFVTIKIEDRDPPCFRAYSISSTPGKNKNTFETCVKIIENGRGSNWLHSLKNGDEITFIGPSGELAFRDGENAFFIATGTGITPFKSMIEEQLTKGNKQKIHLLFGLRHLSDLFYQDFFGDLAKKHSNFSYEITLSRPDNGSWKGSCGRVTKILEETTFDTKNTEYYLCGLKAMIDEVTKILLKKGVPGKAINAEKFD